MDMTEAYFALKDYDMAEKKNVEAEKIWSHSDEPLPLPALGCKFILAKIHYRKGMYE